MIIFFQRTSEKGGKTKIKKIKLLIGLSIFLSITASFLIYTINQKYIHVITVGYDIEVESDYAYVSHNDGVEIINIENKNRPSVVGNIDINDGAFGMVRNGDLLYIAGDSAGLVIANVSNPRQPTICSETAFDAASYNIAYQNDLVFLLLLSDTVKIVNVSDPSSPHLITTYSSAHARDYRDIVVSGNTIFIADGQRGVEIVNISSPSNPTLLHTIVTSAPIALFKFDNMLFLGCHGVGVKWYDVANLTVPILKGSYQEPGGEAYGVWGNSTHLFVADLQKGIYCLNIAENGRLSKGNQYLETAPHDISGEGDYVYLADQDFRLKIFDTNLNCLYNGHKRSYWLPISLGIVSLGLILYDRKKSRKKAMPGDE